MGSCGKDGAPFFVVILEPTPSARARRATIRAARDRPARAARAPTRARQFRCAALRSAQISWLALRAAVLRRHGCGLHLRPLGRPRRARAQGVGAAAARRALRDGDRCELCEPPDVARDPGAVHRPRDGAAAGADGARGDGAAHRRRGLRGSARPSRGGTTARSRERTARVEAAVLRAQPRGLPRGVRPAQAGHGGADAAARRLEGLHLLAPPQAVPRARSTSRWSSRTCRRSATST